MESVLFYYIVGTDSSVCFFLLVALGMTRLVSRLMPKSLFVLLCISLCCSFVLRVEMLELIIPYLSDIYTNYIMGQESGDKVFF